MPLQLANESDFIRIVVIRDKSAWTSWEDAQLRQPADFHRNFRLFEAMYEHVRNVYEGSSYDTSDSLPAKIRLAKILNVSGTPGETGKRA